ncbi:pilus assembly protein [Halomonas sp. GFAJ-1]|uniref:pilus assembly protein n=1 Tax=Halomonas sp. GFAJ-1 TaxID=1118153 RepID=UPI00023A597F|nr:PilC/PilY family type IV pilus protein [Halomonas sp. GFAJ-1]AVI62217.1 pilus assembly protein PilC [Halomonas sp. GFAJ-1]EHK61316.1 Neisseria PilC domain-containing protein [Halomonas sp. GFAJ-1]
MKHIRFLPLILAATFMLSMVNEPAYGFAPPPPPDYDPDEDLDLDDPEPEPTPDPPPEPEPPIGGGDDAPIDEEFDIPSDRVGISPAPLNVVSRVPPNVLLILDNSESGQEGLDGRVAIGEEDGDRENLTACQPNTFNASACPAGARSPLSKSSTMKRVGLQIIEDYRNSINLGLMAYQQNPASTDRNSFNSGNTVVWRLTERAVDVRYSTRSNPDWYNPAFEGAWNSTIKRYRTRLPNSDFYAFFNVGVPGYFTVNRTSTSLPGPSDDRTEYWRTDTYPTSRQDQTVDRYRELTQSSSCGRSCTRPDAPHGVYYADYVASAGLPLVDSLRQRGIPNWGAHVLSLQLNQREWRTTSSPGLGYLHVPIGGLNDDGTVNSAHWEAIETKLGTQRHDWSGHGNPLTDPEWPLISAGLTPIEGTMYTARDYFLNNGGSGNSFRREQGYRTDISIPNLNNPEAQQCLVNANIWLTDGLPSVDRSGNSLGNNVSGALASAEAALKRLYDDTGARLANPVRTYVVGFNMPPDIANLPNVSDDPLGDLARAGGTERAYFANDEASLNQVMQQVLGNIIAASQSNTSAAVNSDEFGVEDGNLLYTAGFRSEDWSGRLAASEIQTDGSRSQRWNAETVLSQQIGSRRLLTSQRPEGGSRVGVELAANTSGLSNDEVSWLKGNPVPGLRQRQSLLGDIINANPVLLQGSGNRPPLLMVAANDGMLHGFNANTGRELFAYLPAELTQGENPPLRELTRPDYTHRYFMDGTPAVREVNIENGPSAVVVGTMGAGGRTVFALDVSNPGNAELLWEFRHPELGTGVSQPTITQLTDGRWVAIFGNGYNSTSYQASLFVVDIKKAANARGPTFLHLKTNTGSEAAPNGLATPTVTAWPWRNDNSANGARFAYAGDLAGNMWRFPLTEGGSVNRLYQGSADQPITSAPAVTMSSGSTDTLMVLFGTGSYFRNSDVGDSAPQQFLGIQDRVGRTATYGTSDLVTQHITGNASRDGFNLRASTNLAPSSNQRGWRIELPPGERVIAAPSISSSLPRRVRFSTLLPDESDPCGGGRSGFFMSLLADTGGSGGSTTFDLSGDGKPDIDATINGDAITGLQAGTGERLVGVNDGQVERLFIGNPDDPNASPNGDGSIAIGFSDEHIGRRSWRQLFDEEEADI